MRFSVLGPLEVVKDDRPIAFGGVTQRAFLAFLLLNANHTVPVTQAVDALWGRTPPPSAKNMLHNAVWGLRKALKEVDPAGDVVSLLSQKPGYLLRVPADRVDVHQFKALVAEGRAAAGDPARAAARFRRALALWRGQALADLTDSGIAWPVLGALEEARLTAWEDCFEAELSCGRHSEVAGELASLVEAEPLRERLCGQLMLALYRSGRQAEALSVYRRARSVFVAELGIEPGPGLRQLEQAVLSQDPALAVATGPAPVTAPARPSEATAGTWERRRVSLVLVDVRPAAPVTDHQVRDQRLADVFDAVRAVAGRFGGATGGMVGTTVQVIFGADRTQEDDPVRATRAALVLRERLSPADGEPGAEVRFALATGDALVSAEDKQAPSMTVGVSEHGLRLLAVAPAYEIVACESTYRAAREQIEFAPGPAGCWTPLSAEAAPAIGEPLPLVERARETGLLGRLLEDTVRSGRPHLVTLLGDAGLGKTRLVTELLRLTEDHAMPMRGLLPRIRDVAAYSALFEIVKAFAGIQATDPRATAEDKLGRAVRHAVRDTERVGWVETNLRALAGLDRGRPSDVSPDEVWRAARVFLEEAAATEPLMLVLEDLHGADEKMLDFLDELADQLGPVPLLLVATARPELLRRRPGWSGGKRNATTVSLTTLSDAGTAHLLRILFSRYGLSEKDADATFWPDLVARIGGNPRFAEEYVRMLAEIPGAARELRLPESVQAVLAARLDTLPADERAVLQDASVLGMVLWPGAVAAVSGRDVETVRRCLESLVQREILNRTRRSTVAGEPEYVFDQVLTREIAYERLPLDVRANRHRLAASWIERLPVDHAESLAYHYATAVSLAAATGRPTAELSGRARSVLADTGRRAEAMGAWKAAVRCYRAALELCPAHDQARPELLLRYGKSLAETDGGGEVALIEARDALLVSGDIVGAADAEVHLALLADRREGDRSSRLRRDRAMELVSDAEGAEAAGLRCALAMSLVIDGRCEEAREVASRALASADRLDRPDLQVGALKALGAARIDLGEFDGVADLRRAVRICAQHGRPTTRALGNLSCGLARAGLLGELADVRSEGTVSAAKYGDIVAARMLRGTAVVEHYWAGEWAAALDQAGRLLAESGPNWLPLRASWHMVRGRSALTSGDLAGAEDAAALSLGVARRLNDPQDLCPALAFSARAAHASGRKDEARGLVEELLNLLAGRTMLPDIGADFPIVLADLGYTEPALEDVRPSPWRTAAMAFLAGNRGEAADEYRRIGSRPDELQARLAVRAEA